MKTDYDIVVIGGGPGGYVAAIRASQLGKRVAIVEESELGGVCLNWGCIPTKSLLKNAYVFDLIKNSSKYGIDISDYKVNWEKIIQRSRNISKRLNKGIEFLMNKNNIKFFNSKAKILDNNTLSLKDSDELIKTKNIIIATGTKQKNLPGIKLDGKKIISSREAMVLKEIPKKITIIGAGAIGVEFAHLYNTFGSEVTLIESMSRILPNEDEDISKELTSIFSKRKINVLTNQKVSKVESLKNHVKVSLDNHELNTDILLVAIGVTGNISNIGLKKIGIETDKGFILKNKYLQTNIKNIYAIGDVSGPPLLAHVASSEAIVAVEHICNNNSSEMNYKNIPACTYCEPEIASVGLTEKQAKDSGYNIKVGKFPFRALGKSLADGSHEGFVKVIYDDKYGELLGCHIIGHNASNLISEVGIARMLETTYHEILKTVHPHPTLSEAIHEATANAFEEAIHI